MQLKLRDGTTVDAPEGFAFDRGDGFPSHRYLRNPDTRKREWVEVPSVEEIGEWVMDSLCPTPWGDEVESDSPGSWLRILGLI
jgi:hypothetical protein